jgi:protein TonB
MEVGTMNMRRISLLAAIGLMGFAGVPAHAATVTVDPAWGRKVSQLISANYSYPRSAQLRGEQGKAKIKIAISGTGKVLGVELVQSTGSAILDREAVRIPTKVGSFPPPPTGNTIELTFPITWRLEEEK